jgi:RNA polymerase sigma-70 factor (ECF subfamily)
MSVEMTWGLDATATIDDAMAVQAPAMNEQAFEEFYARTAVPLRSYLAHLCGSLTQAEELAQETWFRFLRCRLSEPDFDGRKAYLYRIGTNLLRDAQRHARRWGHAPHEAALEQAASSDRHAQQTHLRTDMQRALERLKPLQREVLWLAYVEGSSHREIASIVGLREPSVRTVLFRARAKMAEVMRSEGMAPV